MANNISVTFKVVGAELSSYIDTIQKKSDNLTNSAIRNAVDQSNKGRDQLKIINDTITALERKSRIETQAGRSILLDRRTVEMNSNRINFDQRKENVYSDLSKGTITEADAKEKITALNGAEREAEERIRHTYRENISTFQEQDRQSKLQTTLAKENIEAIRQTAKENVKAVLSGDAKLGDIFSKATTDEEQLIARLTKDGVKEAKSKEEPTNRQSTGMFGSLLAYDNLNKAITSISNFAATQNGFDYIKSGSSVLGEVLGTVAGSLVGMLAGPEGVPFGAIAGGNAGATIGKLFGEGLGEFEQRRAMERENFYKTRNHFNAIVGHDPTSITNTESIGVSVDSFVKLQTEFAKRRGESRDSQKTTSDALEIEKGYGVDQGISALIVELQRSAKEMNRDLARLVGGVIEKGRGTLFQDNDHTFLSEFLNKFGSLQRELLKNNETVATGTTFDILKRFNQVGGAWSARDPRSLGNVNAVNESLSNPSSDVLKALGFRVLAKENPTAGIFDLRERMQEGIASPGYLQGMMSYVDRIGGDDQVKMNNLSGMFPSLPLSAVKRLFANRESILKGNFDATELQPSSPINFRDKAEANTTLLESNSAANQNALLKDGSESMSTLAASVKSAIEESLSGAVIEMQNGKMTLQPRASLSHNKLPTLQAMTNKSDPASYGGPAPSPDPYQR